MIHLFFEVGKNKVVEELTGEEHKIIRLKGYIQFRLQNGWSRKYDAIVNTGAHTSVIPVDIWRNIYFKELASYEIVGLNPIPECSIPAYVAKIGCRLIDLYGNKSRELEVTAYLASTDTPLIIGFKDLLSEFKVCWDYKNL